MSDAARFPERMSVATTRSIKAENGNTFSRSKDGNTMKGLRGFIRTGQDSSAGNLANPKSKAGPAWTKGDKPSVFVRTMQVGNNPSEIKTGRGPARGSKWMSAGTKRGSMDKDYSKTSEGPAGRVSAKNDIKPPYDGGSSRGGTEKEGKGQPSKMGGRMDSVRSASSWKSGNGQVSGRGSKGKMESLRGRAKTSWER